MEKEKEYYYDIKYKGGHAGLTKETGVLLNICPDRIEFFKLPGYIGRHPDRIREYKKEREDVFSIPYEKIQNVQTMTKKEITAGRIALTGLIGLAWKKKKEYMVITYEDEIGMVQNPVFDLGKKIKEVQPLIYQKVVEAKKSKA